MHFNLPEEIYNCLSNVKSDNQQNNIKDVRVDKEYNNLSYKKETQMTIKMVQVVKFF